MLLQPHLSVSYQPNAMANSTSNSSASILSSNRIYYLAPLIAVVIALAIFLPSFLGLPLSFRNSNREDDIEIPVDIMTAVDSIGTRQKEAFSELKPAYERWDSEIGCSRFRGKFKRWKVNESAVQQADGGDCSQLKLDHVSVLVKEMTWIPDILDGLYECRCGLSCLWTRNVALADQPDVVLYQSVRPPETAVNALDTILPFVSSKHPFKKRNNILNVVYIN
jgi:alpha-1,4-fucosyltransferase